VVTVANGWTLSDEEYGVLDEFLASIEHGEPMTLEELDGFFCALVAGPELVPPSEFIPEVFGGDAPPFRDMEEARKITDLLMRHWNGIANTMANGEIYMPYLLETEDGVATANEWAEGFMVGMSMRYDSWTPLVEDEEASVALIPVMAFAHEHDPDPELRPAPITPESRNKLITSMIMGLKAIYEYFKENANPIMHAPVQRGPKIGRNEPCPCGSGKKYKKCCGR